MRLHTIELENIRSYERVHAKFEEGITLISGDIGSGKSTILIAIEFALFGLGRGELAGAHLLRHGASAGSATLTFSTKAGTYTISRTLRSSSAGVVQTAGWLEHNGLREQLTPSELKARIYTLLGYPLLFLNRKLLLYRATIYTPQEEMKHLLLQAPQERLEAIRRIFGVDAYKTVRENAQVLARGYKQEQALHTQALERITLEIATLEQQLGSREQIEGQRTQVRAEHARLSSTLAQVQARLAHCEQTHQRLAHERATHALRERSRTLASQELARMHERREQLIARAAQYTSVIERISARLAQIPQCEEDLGKLLAQARAQLEASHMREGMLKAQLAQSLHDPNVSAGERCPTCLQEVDGEHLERVHAQHALERARLAGEQALLTKELAAVRERIASLEEQMHAQQERTALLERKREQEQARTINGEDVRKLMDAIQVQTATLEALMHEEALPADFAAQLERASAELALSRNELERVRSQQLACERRLGMLEQQLAQLAQLAVQRDARVREQASLRLTREQARAVHEWILERFSPVTEVIEQRVLHAVHGIFNAKLQDVFAQLVGDERVVVTADSQFSVCIEQEGYDVDVATLSGGERSAIALAYRLALVHTMHALMTDLSTSGLLLFDEPTDGFSTEQLVRLQDVLRTLQIGQILLVSHDAELEGCADAIVRVERSATGSRLVDA